MSEIVRDESRQAWRLFIDGQVVGECAFSVPPEAASYWWQRAFAILFDSTKP